MTKTQTPSKKSKGQKTRKADRTALVVLGMHRSGTSALAGTLNILGCDAPATPMDINSANEKGYFESKRIYPLHTELLASAGSRWDDWLPINPGWFDSPRADEFRDRAVETLQHEFGTSRLFVLKDPRISRLVPFWRAVLADIEVTPRFVLTLRNPLETAASLAKRDAISTELSLLIWLHHMLQAEADTRGLPRCFVSFAQLIDSWAAVVETIQTGLGIALPRMSMGVVPEVEAFLSDDLRHHAQEPQKLLGNPLISGWVRDSYEVFLRWTETGEDKADFATLDRVRSAFEASAPSFVRLVQTGREKADAAREAAREVERLKGETATLSAAASDAKTQAETVARTAEELRTRLAEREADLKAQTARETELRGEAEALAKTTEELRTRLAERETALETLRAETARNETERRRLGQDAEEAQHRLERVTAELADQTSERDRLQARHAAESARADELDRRLRDLEETLRQSQSALAQRSHEADEMRRSSADFERQLEEKTAALEAAERRHKDELAALRTQSEDRETLLSAKVLRKTEQVNTLEANLQKQYRELTDLTRILTQHESALEAERKTAAKELDSERGARKAAEATLSGLQQQFEEDRTRHASLIAARDQQIRDLDGRLSTNTREFSDMTRMLADAEHALKLEQARFEEMRVAAERAEYAVTAIQSSTSWRLMAPLRALSAALRRKT